MVSRLADQRRWEEIQSSFDELVELNAEDRASRLSALTDIDPDLGRAVEALLAAEQRNDHTASYLLLSTASRQSDFKNLDRWTHRRTELAPITRFSMEGTEKGDTVVVLSGRDRGKQGKVLKVNAMKATAIVERVNFLKKHTRANPQQNAQGGEGLLCLQLPLQWGRIEERRCVSRRRQLRPHQLELGVDLEDTRAELALPALGQFERRAFEH